MIGHGGSRSAGNSGGDGKDNLKCRDGEKQIVKEKKEGKGGEGPEAVGREIKGGKGTEKERKEGKGVKEAKVGKDGNDGAGDKMPRPPQSRLQEPVTSAAPRRPPNALGPAAEPAASTQFIQSLLDLLANAPPNTTVQSEIDNLQKARAENEQMRQRLDAQTKEMAANEKALRRTIESKEVIASKELRKMFDAVRSDVAAERDSAEQLRRLKAERVVAMRDKEAELASVKAKGQAELKAQREAFHDKELRSHREYDARVERLEADLARAEDELRTARTSLAGQKRKLEDTELLLKAEEVRRRKTEQELANMDEEMGLTDCDLEKLFPPPLPSLMLLYCL